MSGVALLRLMIRRHALATGLIAAIPLLVGTVIGLVYPTYHTERALIQTFAAFARFFGQDQLDLFSETGAFSLAFQHPIVLVAYAVMAAVPALALPAGARGDGTLDVLLATPLSRRHVALSVSAYQAACALALGATTLAAASWGAWLAGVGAGIPWGRYAVVATVAATLVWWLAGVALVASVLARDRGQATVAYGVVVFLLFLTDVTARLWRDGEWLAWLTPYGWLRPSTVIGGANGAVSGLEAAAGLAGTAIVLHAAARWLMERRRSA